jgi:predicted  nucleic acid-binding Zn ribbon protein
VNSKAELKTVVIKQLLASVHSKQKSHDISGEYLQPIPVYSISQSLPNNMTRIKFNNNKQTPLR